VLCFPGPRFEIPLSFPLRFLQYFVGSAMTVIMWLRVLLLPREYQKHIQSVTWSIGVYQRPNPLVKLNKIIRYVMCRIRYTFILYRMNIRYVCVEGFEVCSIVFKSSLWAEIKASRKCLTTTRNYSSRIMVAYKQYPFCLALVRNSGCT
jgi:hypothetical protein